MTRSPLASPSATVEALQRFRLYTKKSYGQHFLVDNNVIERIMHLADLRPESVVVEVGPGIGTLTLALLQEARGVVAVERDKALFRPLTAVVTEFRDRARDAGETAGEFALVEEDALLVTPAQIAAECGSPVAMVANLPYQVAATVVLRTFEEFDSIASATVMVQAEVAQRMAAVPGTKSYGAYTVKLNLLAKPAGSFAVARNSFLPPPRVESTVIRLNRRGVGDGSSPTLVRTIEEYRAVARVVDGAFSQRRKTIRNCLLSTMGLPAATVDRALAEAGIDPGLRAEALVPEAFITLTQKMQYSAE